MSSKPFIVVALAAALGACASQPVSSPQSLIKGWCRSPSTAMSRVRPPTSMVFMLVADANSRRRRD